jgi:hypothetical protein
MTLLEILNSTRKPAKRVHMLFVLDAAGNVIGRVYDPMHDDDTDDEIILQWWEDLRTQYPSAYSVCETLVTIEQCDRCEGKVRGPIADAVCAAVFNDDGDDWVYWFDVDDEFDQDNYRLMDAFWLDRE